MFKLNSNKIFLFLIVLAFFPVYWPMLPVLEGKILPVTTKMEVVSESNLELGDLVLYVDFEKKRNCEYLGMFASYKNEKISINFGDDEGQTDATRPTGKFTAGPWFFAWNKPSDHSYEMIQTDGLKITLRHNCHPLWTTITNFYP